MTCPNICGESLLRVMRVAEDAKISERLGINKMEAAGLLVRILDNDELLKRKHEWDGEMAMERHRKIVFKRPIKKDSSHGDTFFMARLSDEMGITRKLQVTPIQALSELLEISLHDSVLQIAKDRYLPQPKTESDLI